MTRQELAQKLDHLDPGAALKVDRAVLRAAFADASAKDMIGVLEAFAAEHRCSFSPPTNASAAAASKRTTSSKAAVGQACCGRPLAPPTATALPSAPSSERRWRGCRPRA